MSEKTEESFTHFVLAHQSRLLHTAYLLTGNRASAEDLLQTALLKTYGHWTKVSSADPSAFVRRVMVTTHISWARRLWSREDPTAELPEQSAPSADEHPDERKDSVMQALRELPPRMRAVVVLRYYEDLSEADTAAQLGCSVGTVKTQASRGAARLRASLAGLAPHTRSQRGTR